MLRKLLCIVIFIVVAIPAAQAASVVVTQLEPWSDISGNTYDLTSLGTSDWVIYGSASVTPNESMSGGSGIGALSFTDTLTNPQGLGSTSTGRDPNYSWTNGTSTPSSSGSGSNITTHVSDPAVGNGGSASIGHTFSLTVDADTSLSQLYIWMGATNSFFDLTATLPGDSAVQNFGTGNNNVEAALFRIDFTADNPSDLLSLTFEKTTVTGGGASLFGIQAMALSVIPEPSTALMFGLAGTALYFLRRQRK
jgi:hypothetical protein